MFRRLLALAMPVVGLNVLNVLTLFVDTAMCARLPEAEVALAALGFSTQLVFLLTTAMIGLTVGTVALVARASGAGDGARVEHIVLQSSQLAVVLAVIVAVVGNLLAGPALSVLGATGEVYEEGLRYLRPSLLGSAVVYLTYLYGALFRGTGNTRTPFLVAIGTNLVNVVANYGLILGHFGLPALGVAGAAIGTIIAYAASVGAYLFLLTRRSRADLRLTLRPRSIDRSLATEMLQVGAPAALDSVILNVSFLAVIGMLGHIDELAVAAHGLGLRVQGLAFVPGLGVSMATAAMVGQALGARRVDEARAVARASVLLCLIVMLPPAILFLVGAGPIVGAFDVRPGEPLGDLAVTWIRVLGWGMPIFGVHIALLGVLQGAGATGLSLRINVLGTFALQIPIAVVLAFPLGMGPLGVWLSFPIGFALKTALEAAAYRGDRWAKVGVHVEQA